MSRSKAVAMRLAPSGCSIDGFRSKEKSLSLPDARVMRPRPNERAKMMSASGARSRCDRAESSSARAARPAATVMEALDEAERCGAVLTAGQRQRNHAARPSALPPPFAGEGADH